MNQELESLPWELEELRVAGQLDEVIERARQHANIPAERIEEIPPEDLKLLMQVWRILAVSLMSLYKREWNGNKVAHYLLQAQEVFQRFYHHPRVIESAQNMTEDSHQAEYRMRAEMLQDEGRYWQYMAELTGNPSFLDKAIECFNQAIQASQEKTSAWGVAIMEREIAHRQKEEPINWKEFSLAYQTVVDLSPQAGGWDRKAAVSWWYVREAILSRRKDDIVLGLENLRSACQEGNVNWIIRYPLKEFLDTILGISRRITYSKTYQ